MASRASTKSKAKGGGSAGKANAKVTKAGKGAKGKTSVKAGRASKAAPAGKATLGRKSVSKSPVKAKKAAPKKAISKPASKRPRSQPAPAAPPRYHTVTASLNVKGAEDAIEFYKKAFGAQERVRMPNADGTIMHAELVIGDSTIILSDAIQSPESRSSMHLTVADCDALFERAVSAGGRERMAMQDMFWGDRYGQVEDPFGNIWAISTHKEDVPADELSRRAQEFADSQSAAPPPPESSDDLPSETA